MRGNAKRNAPRQRQGAGLRKLVMLTVLAIMLPLVAFIWHLSNTSGQASMAPKAIGPAAYPPASAMAALPHHRAYTIERQSSGFALMVSDDPATHVLATMLPDSFGSDAADSIAALNLSPDQRWLAIDGMHEQGDSVWIVATGDNSLHAVPNDASGSFLHWMPDGEHFLYRPYLPTRGSDNTWNPGLWIVDAASGTHVNLALPNNMSAMNLVDATPSPDGSHIVLSVTTGLGQGSAVYMATPDGLSTQPLFQSAADVAALTWSPNGQQIAYETIEDSTIPFRSAGLWTMGADASGQRQIALTDGGHGFAPAWSPDGTQLAFVARLNDGDANANSQAGQLVSAVQVANVTTGSLTTVAAPAQTGQPRNVAPAWQGDGSLLFTAMGASNDPGAAIVPGHLWHTTTLNSSHTQFQVAPLSTTAAMDAATLVP